MLSLSTGFGHASSLFLGVWGWVRLLRSWRSTVSVGSFKNLIRPIRSSWVAELSPAQDKRVLPLTLLWPCRRKIKARLSSSDILVLEEVFKRQVYNNLIPVALGVNYIIDCGANVGYASAFFLDRFPGSRVFAVEPDQGNVALYRLNLASEIEQGRVSILQAAVWSSEEALALERNGLEWGFRVAPRMDPAAGVDSMVRGYSLAQLVGLSRFPHVDVLKVDIEGAELPVFAAGVKDELLATISTIVIELHGAEAATAFHAALHGKPFTFRRFGEYVVAENQKFSACCAG